MASMDQSVDEFEELGDELLMYSYSTPFEGKNSPRTKQKKPIHINPQKPHLSLLQTDNNNLSNQAFFKTFYGKQSKGQRGRSIRIGDATFRSNFQCGNIAIIDCVSSNTYRMSMERQTNSERMSIWFYFSCQGLKGDITFVIAGFTKGSSLYNEGMKVCYKESVGGGGWRRGGTKISYVQTQNLQQEITEYQLKFNFFFQNNSSNVVEFAYCFPYSFTRLLNFVHGAGNLVMVETLAKTMEGRAIPLLTIGDVTSKNVIFMSARVHPGQTVSSFIMQGFIKELISDSQFAKLLRKNVLFKILPMINPDGVIRGNYRFSAAGCDLNRKWRSCKPQKHPQIYYWREYMRKVKLQKQKTILMYIDLHGHSRKKGVFFYGCSKYEDNHYQTKPKQFPYLMQQLYPSAFKYDYCSFAIQKDKEGTARIAMWKDLKIDYVYTCESTFCGGVSGGNFVESDYQKIGSKLCEGIAVYFSSEWVSQMQVKEEESFGTMVQISKKIKQEMQNNVSLQEVGMNGDSGSDSEPDLGENTSNIFQNGANFTRPSIRTSKISKKHTQQRSDTKQLSRKQILNINRRKQRKRDKTDTGDVGDAQFPISIERAISTAKAYKSQQLQKPQTATIFNHRILSQNKNIRINLQSIKARLASQQQSTQNQQNHNTLGEGHYDNIDTNSGFPNHGQALRRKLMLERGGAQYRRVRKIAEQSSRQKFSNNHGHHSLGVNPVVRGLVGVSNLIELQSETKKTRTIAPSFYPHQSQSSRKGSIEMYFRKQIKVSQYNGKRVFMNGQELQVKCYGSKIAIKH